MVKQVQILPQHILKIEDFLSLKDKELNRVLGIFLAPAPRSEVCMNCEAIISSHLFDFPSANDLQIMVQIKEGNKIRQMHICKVDLFRTQKAEEQLVKLPPTTPEDRWKDL